MFLNKETSKTVIRNIRIRIFAVIVVAVLCVTSVFAATVSAYTVTIYDGDNVVSVKTSAQEPSEILSQAGVAVGDDDSIDLSAFVSGQDSSITVKRAFPVVVVDASNETKTVMTTQDTVGGLLEQMDIQVSEDDVLSHELDESIKANTRLQIKKSFPVTVVADGKTSVIRAVPGTVGTNLFDAGFDLNRYELAFPIKSDLARRGMVLNINRIKTTYRREVEEIPFSVIRTKSDTLEEGKTQKIQSGRVGKKSIIYKDTVVKDEIRSTVAISEIVMQEPVDEKWLIGTKKPSPPSNVSNASKGAISTLTPPSWLMIDENGVPNKYRYILRGESTAYYEPKGSLTATGKKVRLGYIAVDPREIPYGTEMYIVSEDGKYVYGYCIAADTGGFIYNSDTICDLYFSSESQCRKFGRRDVIIYVL